MRKLSKKFYQQNTLKVAQDLLGCFLIRKYRGKTYRAMITETEAYIGEDDLACHASKGRTPRTEIMYREAGHAYVYMIYGMYHCLNVVTEKKGFPAAVLIRSVDTSIDASISKNKTDGPGKLCRELKIDRKLNGWDLTKGEELWIEARRSRATGEKSFKNFAKRNIVADKRIGIDYAKHCKHYLWKFALK